MKKLLLTTALVLCASSAWAQNVTCPTRPLGDNSNACASTAFVQNSQAAQAIGVGTTPITAGTNTRILFDNSGVVGEYILGSSFNISASTLQNQDIAARLFPKATNFPGGGPANQTAVDSFGAAINIGASTTSGVQELLNNAAASGAPVNIGSFGVNSAGTNLQFLGMSSTLVQPPRGLAAINIVNSTVQFSFGTGANGWEVNSQETGFFNACSSQFTYGGTGSTFVLKPTTVTPQDKTLGINLYSICIKSLIGQAGTQANFKVDLSNITTLSSSGIGQDNIQLSELNGNGGAYGYLVTDPVVPAGGNSWYYHNDVDVKSSHGHATAEMQIGLTGANKASLFQNRHRLWCSNSAAIDCLNTYESNGLYIIGADSTFTGTNEATINSGAINNVFIDQGKGGGTNGVVDANASGSGGNIVIGQGAITISRIPVVIALSPNVSQALDTISSGAFSVLYHGASVWTGLAANISTTMGVFTMTGTGAAGQAPVWTTTSGTGNIPRTDSPIFTTQITSPKIVGGSLSNAGIVLEPSSAVTPANGSIVSIAQSGNATLYMGAVCSGQSAPGFVGFAVGNNGQADCTHYNFMSDGTNTYFNSATGILSFRIGNTEYVQLSVTTLQPVDNTLTLGNATHRFVSVNSVVYNSGANTGVGATKTVRAAGGAADCTLIFTGGILTGGSC